LIQHCEIAKKEKLNESLWIGKFVICACEVVVYFVLSEKLLVAIGFIEAMLTSDTYKVKILISL
jgi:hypothetical protein